MQKPFHIFEEALLIFSSIWEAVCDYYGDYDLLKTQQ